MKKLTKRFWAKVKRLPSGCWEWQGYRHQQGYGRINIKRKMKLAHRVSFFLTTGHWPKNDLLHRCDNPPCVRPSHLKEGTHTDNMQDAARKHKWAWRTGERHPRAKLKYREVLRIRKYYRESVVSQQALATQFRVSRSTIAHIVRGETW